MMRRFLASMFAAATLMAPMAATPPETMAQPSAVVDDSLVNVQIVGVRIIRDVDVNAIAGVVAAANVCPNVSVDLAALASLVDQSGDQQTVNCDADAQPDLIIRQNEPRNR
jgi:hypothetical protein